jgi:RNA polymerase II subunit A small phosphatase-like protein
MDGPAIITQVTNPKEDEARSPVAGEKGEEGHGQLPRGA